jgi:Glycosyl hydrolases family 18
MKKLFSIVLMLLVMSSFTQAQYKGKYVGWSTGYVYGGGTLSAELCKAFTHLVNFHITVGTDGSLGTGDLPQSNQASFVSQCHANGCKALLCLGGEGEHAHFVAATATTALQTTLIKNIMAMALQYGYDGVDLDWEVAEDPNYDNSSANVAHFKAFHQQVRDSVRAHPPMLITAAVTDDWYPNCSAAVCPIVDQANGMSYDQTAASEYADAMNVFRLGAPKSNHGIGFDMSKGAADNLAKCRLAIDSSFGGVMAWSITGFATSMFDSLARYVNKSTAIVYAPSQMRGANGANLFVRNNRATGLNEIFFTVPLSANGMPVDLSMYDVEGRLVRTIFHGERNAGSFVAPIDQNCSGMYVFRLSENASVQSTKAFVVK